MTVIPPRCAPIQRFGRLDAAFNNAADPGHYPTPLAQVAPEDFDQALGVSLRGVFLCMRQEIPAMLETGGGAIVNMSSTGGLRGVPGLAGYVASKHGVIGLTRSAALDYAASGLRINALAPASIVNERIARLPAEQQAPIRRAIPMQRLGEPAEVADAAVWLCSDAASFVTGTILTLDGGKLAGGA